MTQTQARREIQLNTTVKLDTILDPAVKVYLPVNPAGEVVHPKLSTSLECWVYDPARPRDTRAPICEQEVVGQLTLALVHQEGQEQFYSFYENVLDIKAVELYQWSMHLHRDSEHDIHMASIKVV